MGRSREVDSRFGEALRREAVPRRLGDVRLRYDAELLIGEKVPALDMAALIPDAMVTAGILASLGAGAALIFPQYRAGGLWGTLLLAALAAAVTLAGIRLGGLRRGRRGFVVNFDRYLLRLDQPWGLRIRSATMQVPFSAVREVLILEREGGRAALALRLEDREAEVVLVDGAQPAERPQLERLRKVLEAAFGPNLDPGPAGPIGLSPPGGA